MIWQLILIAIMLISLWQLLRISKKGANDPKKRAYAIGLFIVVVVCGALAARLWYGSGSANSEGFAHEKATVMARAQGWGLGRYILENCPGQRAIVVADLDGMKQFVTDFEAGFREAGMENFAIVNLTLEGKTGNQPKLLVLTARDFDRAVEQDPAAGVAVSLVGIPAGKLKITDQKKPLLLAQIGVGSMRMAAELKFGRVAAAIGPNPKLAKAATPDFPSDSEAAFAHFFVMQTAPAVTASNEGK